VRGDEWIVRRTSDLEVGDRGPFPSRRVVSLNKKLGSTLSLSIQMYKMGTGNILLVLTLQWSNILSRGGGE